MVAENICVPNGPINKDGEIVVLHEIGFTWLTVRLWPPSQLFRLCLWGAFVISAAWAWWIEHVKFVKEQEKNEGSRIEGDIIVALVDSKKGTNDGRFELLASGCYVYLCLTATNMNPPPAYLNPGKTSLCVDLEGRSYKGKYEMLPYGQVDYFTDAKEIHPSSGCRDISDFFLSGLQRFPMERGVPRQGWIRFYFPEMDEPTLQRMSDLRASLTLIVTDTLKKQHPIPSCRPLQLGKVRHKSEPPIM
jgi:hypothetical protein